jgi:hypothetical protein
VSTITWLGEGSDSPPFIVWNGVTFALGQAVAVEDPWMLGKARNNRYFSVSNGEFAAAPPPAEPLPEMPPAPPLTEQLQVIKRKRGRPPKVKTNADQ